MPTYTYKCIECDHIFDEFHLMSETIDKCVKCDSEHVTKVLPKSMNMVSRSNPSKPKVGNIVNDYIKDVKQELKEQKEQLSSKEYKIK
jgi:putative FmdB family regulatory protein|tara:strand:- start:181 stop:444 length:264 start_codon:yes stop_codon:yes gene_type:complete